MTLTPRWLVVLLASSAVLAQTTTPLKLKKKRASSQAAVTAQDIKSLRDALAAQQQQIQALAQQMQQRDQALQQAQQQLQQAQEAAREAQHKAADLESSGSRQTESVSKLETQVNDMKASLVNTVSVDQDQQKRVSAIEDLLGRFRLSGDVRLRQDSFFQNYSGCPSGCAPRFNERLRIRLGLEGALNSDFIGGIYLASGFLSNPISTNETLTNAFERKTVGFDRGYITYNPVGHRWLSLTGGKFAYTWNRLGTSFDPDINPEGFSEKFSFDTTNSVFRNVSFTGMQLLMNQIGSATGKGGPASFAAGGQVATVMKLGPVTTTPSFTILNFRNADILVSESASVVGATTTGSTKPAIGPLPVPGPGSGCAAGSQLPSFAPCVLATNGFTNATVVDKNGKVHFLSQFLYADFIVDNTIQTGWNRFPLRILGEYENNLNAADHPQPGVGKQSHTYLIDASLGQLKERGDFNFGYAFQREEQDAAIAAYVESEQRAPTNVIQHRVYFQWKVRRNTVVSATDWIGRTLNSNLQHAALAPGIKPGQQEPYLNRLQFDVIYTF